MGATSLGQLGIMENKNEEKDWSVLQGTLDHKPIFTSFRLSVNTKENYRQYPYQIGVAVPLLNPTVHDLPTNDEATQLWAIIDELKSKLETDYKSLYVMSLTTGGMREFVFYTSEWKPKEIEKAVKEIEKEINDGHELQFMMQEDKSWMTYKIYSNQ
jgi:Family of unknown function (DUF695)